MITVDTSQLRDKVRRTMRLLDGAHLQALGLAEYFLTVIKARTPRQTGETAKSWTIHYHKTGDSITWEISPDGKEDIVTFLEFGTKPHVIAPDRGGVLVFEIEGKTIFARYVFHPGTKPLGFVRITQDDLDKSISDIVDRLLTRISSMWGS